MSMYKWGLSVPDFVKNYRRKHNLTQLQLANMLKVHPQYVSNVERGTHKDPVAFCAKLGKLLPQDQWSHLVSLVSDSVAESTSKEMAEIKQTRLRRHESKKD